MAQTLDPRNRDVLHWVDGRFVSRHEAAIPLFDAGLMHGKLVWSSPRLVNRRIFRFADHLQKIRHSAEMNFWPRVPSDEAITDAVRQTLVKNKMEDGAHIRIMVSAGNQQTASMDLGSVVDDSGEPSAPRLMVAPEYRSAVYDPGGIRAITSSLFRAGPDTVDQRSHDNNQNASARACYEAKQQGVTTALMYDTQGFLAEAFASHAAIVRNGNLHTPLVRCNPDGVTRRVILELCAEHEIEAEEADITKAQVAAADEVFIMGTMSGPVAITELDGQTVGDGTIGPVTRRLSDLYQEAMRDPAQGFAIFD